MASPVNLMAEMSKGWFYGDAGIVTSTDPIRSRIRQAILYGLRNRIVSGDSLIRYSSDGDTTVDTNGYYFTIKNAYDPPRDEQNMSEYPCVNVELEGEQCENTANVQIDQNQSLLHNSFILKLDVYMSDINDPALAQDKVLADIQRYFGANYHIPDSNGDSTAFNIYYDSSIPWGTRRTEPNTGITARFRVWYRQKLTKPYESG